MDNIENYKDAFRSVQNKEIEQRKNIKKLLQDREELKKQLILSGVSQQRELLSQYTEFLNWKLPVEREIKLTEIKEFFDWLNCG